MRHKEPIEETQERASLYAIGALSQHEARSFERHLSEGCPVCEKELAQFESTIGLLSLSASPVEPAPRVKDALLRRIKTEPRARLTRSVSIPAAPRRNYVPWAVAACLVLVSAVVLYVWQNSRSELNSLQARLADSDHTIQQLESRVRQQLERSEQLQTIVQTLKQPGAQVFRLTSQKKEPDVVAEIYPDSARHRWIVDVALPPVPAGQTYQLWFVKPGAPVGPPPVSAGLIKTDPSGRGFTVVDVPENIGKLAAAAISVEPEGGSPTPTRVIATAALDSGTR